MNSKLAAALAWAARGFRVFPLLPNSADPAWKGWTELATTDPAVIRSWWEGTDQNIGCLTTDLAVFDLDTKPAKDTGLPRRGIENWLELHGGFDDTLTVRTRSGGFHLYYRDAHVANSAGDLYEGIDVRGYHGYVVAPGSIIDGRGYEVEIDAPLLPAPARIVALCRKPGERAENASEMVVTADTDLAVSMAMDRIARTPGAVSGEQSEAAYKLAAAVRDCGVSEPVAAVLMQEWADRCSPPLLPDDVRMRVENAYLYAQNPGGSKNPEAVFGSVVIPPLPSPAVQAPQAQPLSNTSDLFPFGNTLDLRSLAPRPHVLKHMLMRREVSMLIAPGGAGKSLMQLAIAVHLAAGIDCFGYKNYVGAPAKSIVYDAEDNLEEMSMRLYAVCDVLGIEPDAVKPHIALISGKSHWKLTLATGGHTPQVCEDAKAALIAAASDPAVAMLSLNPLNKLHTLNGLDNIAMTFVMDVLEDIADQANVALLLAHHTSKPGMNKIAGNADASQGAAAITNSARIAFTLTAPSDEDAAQFNLTGADRERLLRIDNAKNNRALGGRPVWLQKVGVTLWNGEEVGGLSLTEMFQRTEHMRRLIAETLSTAMVDQHLGSIIKLADAVEIVRGRIEMFMRMRPADVKLRIEGALTDPVTLDGQRQVRLLLEQGGLKVALA
jgi:Bifunctional DNA primase/polymerase, N-terminal/AAA domain